MAAYTHRHDEYAPALRAIRYSDQNFTSPVSIRSTSEKLREGTDNVEDEPDESYTHYADDARSTRVKNSFRILDHSAISTSIRLITR
jgi:hypothetical protein